MMTRESEIVLLIDNSNTRTKCLLACDGELREDTLCVVPTPKLSVSWLRAYLADHDVARAVVASVVPDSAAMLKAAFSFPVEFITPRMVPMMDWDYPGLPTLGADRIANAVAIASMYPLPCVAVDLGTAVTFEVVVERQGRPCFVGGAIAPGWRTMAKGLSSSTALLPDVSDAEVGLFIGRSTEDSIQIGITRSLSGMVREMLQGIQKELGQSIHVVITGGDASLLARCLPDLSLKVDPLLTFRGLLHAVQK